MTTIASTAYPETDSVDVGDAFDEGLGLRPENLSLAVQYQDRQTFVYLAREDVKRLRDHLTEVLGDTAPAATIVYGRTYALLPGATMHHGGRPIFWGVTRVVAEGPGAFDENVVVRRLDGGGMPLQVVARRFLAEVTA